MNDVTDLIQKYREAAIKAGNIKNTKKQHFWHDEYYKYFYLLRDTEEGKKGIMKLMDDQNVHVRLASATFSLFWDEKKAREVLEKIKNIDSSKLNPDDWHVSLTATLSLSEFDKGNLNFEQ